MDSALLLRVPLCSWSYPLKSAAFRNFLPNLVEVYALGIELTSTVSASSGSSGRREPLVQELLIRDHLIRSPGREKFLAPLHARACKHVANCSGSHALFLVQIIRFNQGDSGAAILAGNDRGIVPRR